MTRRIYFYFSVTIVLGAILGGLGEYGFLWYTGRVLRHGGFNKERALAHLRKELDLSNVQTQQIGEIFDESFRKVGEVQKQMGAQFEAIHQETRARIRQVLSPAQAQKFDELVRQIDERLRRRGPPLPPPPPPR